MDSSYPTLPEFLSTEERFVLRVDLSSTGGWFGIGLGLLFGLSGLMFAWLLATWLQDGLDVGLAVMTGCSLLVAALCYGYLRHRTRAANHDANSVVLTTEHLLWVQSEGGEDRVTHVLDLRDVEDVKRRGRVVVKLLKTGGQAQKVALETKQATHRFTRYVADESEVVLG